MTVPSTQRRAGPYNGNDVATSFSFSFKVDSVHDIEVVYAAGDGADVTLVYGSDYDVTLNVDQDATPGGTVTYPITGSPLATGERLTVVGATEYTQELDLSSGGNFNPRAIENALDRQTYMIQQLLEMLNRTLSLPVSADAQGALPSPLANAVIGWSSDGTQLVNLDAAGLVTAVTYGTTYVETFTADGTVGQQFILAHQPGALNNIQVYVGSVWQAPTDDFTFDGNVTVTSVAAFPNGETVKIRYNNALPVGQVSDGAITTNKIVDANVTTAKLADASVTTAKIADANVTSAKLAASSVTQAKVADGVMRLTRSTAVTASGQTSFAFDDVPSWAKRIVIDFSSVVKNTGGDNILVKFKVGGVAVSSGYATCSMSMDNGATPAGSSAVTSGFPPSYHYVDGIVRHGRMVLENVTGNTWVNNSQMGITGTTPSIGLGIGSVTLSDVPSGVLVTSIGGTATFTTGTINVMYEG